jgi:hypothetical protein
VCGVPAIAASRMISTFAAPSSPSPIALSFSSRFSKVSSATTSFNALASRRSSSTSSAEGARAVSPVRCFLAASRIPSTSDNRGSGHPLAAAQFGDTLLAAQTRKDDGNLLLTKNCRRFARRISFTICSVGSFIGPVFLSHLYSFNGYNGPEILLYQIASRSKFAIAHLDISKATTLGNLDKLVLSPLAFKISLNLRLGGLPDMTTALFDTAAGEASPLVIIVLPHREASTFRHGSGQPGEHPLGARRGSCPAASPNRAPC